MGIRRTLLATHHPTHHATLTMTRSLSQLMRQAHTRWHPSSRVVSLLESQALMRSGSTWATGLRTSHRRIEVLGKWSGSKVASGKCRRFLGAADVFLLNHWGHFVGLTLAVGWAGGISLMEKFALSEVRQHFGSELLQSLRPSWSSTEKTESILPLDIFSPELSHIQHIITHQDLKRMLVEGCFDIRPTKQHPFGSAGMYLVLQVSLRGKRILHQYPSEALLKS